MMKEEIREKILDTGAVAVGFAEAAPVDEREWERLQAWLAAGHNAGMDYMSRWQDIRRDPRLLLDGARTVISIAYSFAPPVFRDPSLGEISVYAYGRDYHDVLRKRLRPVVREFEKRYGGSYRICIDSAPILERFWAQRAGIGVRGDNHMLIVPGHGSMVFLAEIITTLGLEPDTPLVSDDINANTGNYLVSDKLCTHCGACLRACPGRILQPDSIDCRNCLSYLTIEEIPDYAEASVLDTDVGRKTLFGCDRCLRACPLNRDLTSTTVTDFHPSEAMLSLDADAFRALTRETLTTLLPGSPLRRRFRSHPSI